VADVIHLIAELAENATIYSPPNAPVRIHGDIVGRGFAIEIEDRGLGIAEDKLAEINSNLAHPPQFDLSGSEQLGLFVAGQLARRHDIRITLQPSPFGGITAIVLLPTALIVDEGSYEIEDLPVTATERAVRLTGRHATLNPVGTGEMASLTLPGIAPPDSGAAAAGHQLPGSADDPLTRRPAADPLTSPAGDLPIRRPASDLPNRQPGTGLPTRRPAADPLTSPAGDPSRATADPLTRPAEDPVPSPAAWPSASQGSETPPVAAEPDGEPESLFTPRRPRPPAPGPAGFGQDQPRSGADDPDLDPRVTTTELVKMGLPVRRRRASLAPQLRDNGVIAHNVTDRAPRAPSPEAARSTMTALQRGWERGRDASGVTPSFDGAQTPEPNGDGDEQRSDE
jgi:hypothetical protein